MNPRGAGRPKPNSTVMSLAEIAQAEGITISAVHVCLSSALCKLRDQGLLQTARELAQELDGNRASEHFVYRRNARRGGSE